MTALLAVLGWALAAAAAVALVRTLRRLELAARAEHELRGPLAAIALGLRALQREGGGSPAEAVAAIEAQLERVRIALADLEAARHGRRAPAVTAPVVLEPLVRATGAGYAPLARRGGGRLEVDWRAGAATVRADRGRLSQVLGNLLANAVEHGGAHIRLRGVALDDRVRIEVNDSDAAFDDGRGRGLAIAARAVEDAGGSLSIEGGERGATVAFDLPLAE